MGPDTSALAIWAEAADAERLLSATAPLQPATASVAAIADDLSAKVFAGAATPIESSSTGSRRRARPRARACSPCCCSATPGSTLRRPPWKRPQGGR